MSRRTALWLAGLATLALAFVLQGLDARMTDAGGPGIVGFEFAGSRDGAGEILADWGGEGRDAARASLWLDFLFLTAYGTFGALVAAALRPRAERTWLRPFARPAVLAVPVAAACDVIENVFLLLVLGGRGGSAAPPLAAAFAGVKFALVGLSLLYAGAHAVTALAQRRSRT